MSREPHKTRAFLLGETMVALALLFVLFLVITSASMSAYSNSYRVGQRAQAEELAIAGIDKALADPDAWVPGRTELSSQEMNGITYQIEVKSQQLSKTLVEFRVAVSWRIQERHEQLEKTFRASLRKNP